jgi:hypothetical protein
MRRWSACNGCSADVDDALCALAKIAKLLILPAKSPWLAGLTWIRIMKSGRPNDPHKNYNADNCSRALPRAP